MKKLIEPYKKIIIALSFPYFYLLMVLTIPTGFEGIGPGGLTPVSESIQISEMMGPVIQTVYVLSYEPLTPLQSWLMIGHDDMAVYPRSEFSKTLTLRDQYLRGQVSKRISYTNALIAGYEEAMKLDETIEMDYRFSGLLVYYRPKHISQLDIGDRIVAIDGTWYDQVSADDFLLLSQNDQMTLTIERGGNTFEYDYVQNDDPYPLGFVIDHEITNAFPTYQLPGLDTFVGGPSGGAMQALYVTLSLVNVNTQERSIVGTGTINIDGTIGRIGGLEQKMITAEDAGVDIFFIPLSHQGDVQDLSRFSYEIVYVNSLTEVINAINEWGGDDA